MVDGHILFLLPLQLSVTLVNNMLGLGNSSVNDIPTRVVHNATTNTSSVGFDNTTDYITVADDDLLSHSGTGDKDDTPFSVTSWVKRDSAGNDSWFGKYNGAFVEYRVFWVGGSLYLDIMDGSGGQSGDYRRRIFTDSTTDWHHLAIVLHGPGGAALGLASSQFYIDGVLQSSTAGGGTDVEGMTPSGGDLFIGKISGNSSVYDLGGNICQFTMWGNYALSASEVEYLYANGAAHRDPTVSCLDYSGGDKVVLWLPLDDDLNDSSGNALGVEANGNAALEEEVPF